MPLDNANYISELNLNNPVGSVDTVSMIDDFLRELKKVLIQSFPNINKQTTITSDELTAVKNYFKRSGTSWSLETSSLINVASIDNATAAQPRSYNDARYLLKSNNLSDVGNKNVALYNMMTGLDSNATGWDAMRSNVVNMVYPVGTIYSNGAQGNNPRDWFNTGTWLAFAAGRSIIGVGSTTDTRGEGRFFGNGATGGEFQHVLSQGEMPSHQHGVGIRNPGNYGGSGGYYGIRGIGLGSGAWAQGGGQTGSESLTSPEGGNGAHNNLQPYIAAYLWIRTA